MRLQDVSEPPYDHEVPRTKKPEADHKIHKSIRLSAESIGDLKLVEEHYRTGGLSPSIELAAAEIGRRIRAESPAPKRKR